jgi:hypothetical protein
VDEHRSYPDPGYAESTGWYDDRGGYRSEGRYGGGDYGEYADYGAESRESRRPEPDPGRAQAHAIGPRSGVPIPDDPGPRRPPPVAPGSPGPLGPPGPVGPVTPMGPAGSTGEMYRSRRPAAAILFGVVAGILEIPALVLLRDATFGDGPVSASGVVAAVCLVAALPLLAVGLYAVATGAVRAAGPNSAQAWLRPPVAYLSVGLVLFVAAGFAA